MNKEEKLKELEQQAKDLAKEIKKLREEPELHPLGWWGESGYGLDLDSDVTPMAGDPYTDLDMGYIDSARMMTRPTEKEAERDRDYWIAAGKLRKRCAELNNGWNLRDNIKSNNYRPAFACGEIYSRYSTGVLTGAPSWFALKDEAVTLQLIKEMPEELKTFLTW